MITNSKIAQRMAFQGGGMDMGSAKNQAKSKDIGDKGDFGGLGGGDKFGGDPGKYNQNREVVERVQAAMEAAETYGIPDVKRREGILGFIQDLALNPVSSFFSGNIPGMFASLAFGKGPYTKESLVTGNFADLTNAPADYRQAVLDTMGGTYSEVQKEQIKAGDEAKKAEQEATRGPENPLGDISPTTPMNPFEGDAIKTQRYQDFMVAGYPPDMAEYLVGVLM
jgi:hypothetical protein